MSAQTPRVGDVVTVRMTIVEVVTGGFTDYPYKCQTDNGVTDWCKASEIVSIETQLLAVGDLVRIDISPVIGEIRYIEDGEAVVKFPSALCIYRIANLTRVDDRPSSEGAQL
jgi:hypothetical protein